MKLSLLSLSLSFLAVSSFAQHLADEFVDAVSSSQLSSPPSTFVVSPSSSEDLDSVPEKRQYGYGYGGGQSSGGQSGNGQSGNGQSGSGQSNSTQNTGTQSSNGGNVASSSSFFVPFTWNAYNKHVVAHAVLASVAFMITSPLAILWARFMRHITWFPVHRALQILTTILVIASFGIITKFIHSSELTMDRHHTIGLILFILILIQASLGFFIHHLKFNVFPFNKTATRRSFQNYLHIFIGVFVTCLGWANVRIGMEEFEQNGPIHVPKGVKVVFWIILGIELAAYGLGVILGFGKKPPAPGYQNEGQREMGKEGQY